MGKKNPAPAAAAASTQEEAPKTEKPKTSQRFTFVRGLKEGEKLAPQAQVIVNTIQELKAASREDVVARLSDGRLKTRQPPERILTYYQKALETAGFIKMEKVAA